MTSPDVAVLPASEPPLLHLVQHLRYEVLVGEQGLAPPGADHERRMLADSLDATGTSFAAFEGARLVGTVRVNIVADGGADAFADAYHLADLGSGYEAKTALVTRLINRGGAPLLSKLVTEVLGVVAARGARWIAIGVEPDLVAFYASMGFAPFREDVASPSGARRTVLVFDVEDPRHAKKETLAGWLYPKLFESG